MRVKALSAPGCPPDVEPDKSGYYKRSMYDYRRMSRVQQDAIVRLRLRRGFPPHRPPHPDFGAGWYFITAATFEHRLHFQQPAELAALQRRLLEALEQADRPYAGWVVLPNHYHILVQTETASALGKPLASVHGRSAQYANQRDDTPGRQVWYQFSDRKVRSERHFWTCLHYVIFNPVKHGYVDEMTDWPWSCIHELLAQHGEAWIQDLRRDYPLREFGKNWDD